MASRISAVDKPNFATRGRPFALAFREQPDAHTNPGLDVHLRGDTRDGSYLGKLFGDKDDFLSQLAAKQCHPDEGGVFVAVADDQGLGVVVNGQSGEHLRLGADFEAIVERPAGIENLFNDFAKLVDLDREDPAVAASIVVLRDGTVECIIECLDAVPKQILEADEQRGIEVQSLRLAQHVDDRYGDAGFLQRRNGQVAVRIHAEVAGAPPIDHVQRRRVVDRPRRLLVELLWSCFHRARRIEHHGARCIARDDRVKEPWTKPLSF